MALFIDIGESVSASTVIANLDLPKQDIAGNTHGCIY